MLKNFRPSTIEELFGQAQIVNTVTPWVGNPDTMPHSILFAGDYGCGKTSLARILAHSITNNGDKDVREIKVNLCLLLDRNLQVRLSTIRRILFV